MLHRLPKVTDEILAKRKQELEEVDKLLESRDRSEVFTKDDLVDIVNQYNEFDARIVITDRPGVGKTTAIRKYLVNNNKCTFMYHGLYSTFLEEDVLNFYIDLLASGARDYEVAIYTSNYKNFDTLNDLQKAPIIVCTHMRLFVNPPYMIFQTNLNDMSSNFLKASNDPELNKSIRDKSFREDIIIDEIPTNMYQVLDGEQQEKLDLFNHLSYEDTQKYKKFVDNNPNVSFESLLWTQSLARNNVIDNIYQNYDKIRKERHRLKRSLFSKSDKDFPSKVGLESDIDPVKVMRHMDDLPTNTNATFENAAKKGTLSEEAKFYSENTKYFANVYSAKMLKNKQEGNPYYYLIYSFDDFKCKRMILFSGTGDLLVNNSDKYHVVCNHRRRLNAESLELVHTNCKRGSRRVAEEYANLVNQIMDKNPGKRVLLYTYKARSGESFYKSELGDLRFTNSNNEEEQLDTKGIGKLGRDILELMPEDKRGLLDIIHYQSGKETVTSRFSNDDVLVILGPWFLPKEVVEVRGIIFHENILNGDKESFLKKGQKNYTLHLILQCLYRTVARIDANHPIKIYLDDQYSKEFIMRLEASLDMIGSATRFTEKPTIYPSEDYTKEKFVYTDEQKSALLTDIVNVADKVDNHYEVTSGILYNKIVGTGKVDNSKIKRKLDKFDINYEYVEGTKGGQNETRNPSKFIIEV